MKSLAYFLFFLPLFGLGFTQEFRCFDNEQECAQRLRNLLLDNSAFVFGTNYTEMCAWNPPPLNCANVYPELQSMSAKIFNTTDTTVLSNRMQGLSVLNVSYTAPKESYEACGHRFDIPAMDHVMVDPLREFKYSMRSLTYRPNITWPIDNSNDLYTVIMYDVQFSFLHGMWINCRGGTWEDCETAFRYLPPGIFMPARNVYTFMLFRQNNNQQLDLTQVEAVIQQVLIRDLPNVPFLGLISFPVLYGSFEAILGNPVRLNMIRVSADPYSAREIFNRNFLNMCPFYISQLDRFHSLVNILEMPVAWSNPKYTETLYSSNAYLTSLSINIDVKYDSDEYHWETCCNEFSLSQGSRSVDPFSEDPLPGVVTRHKPVVRFSPMTLGWQQYTAMRDETYIFLQVDVPDEATDGRVWLHWAVSDIKNADITTGTTQWEYFQPAPLTRSTDMFLLFRQTVPTMSMAALRTICPTPPTCRPYLRDLLTAFMVSNPIGVTFFRVERDSYIERLYYDVFRMSTEHEICRGRQGYDSPCPSKHTEPIASCPNSANVYSTSFAMASLSILTLAAITFKKIL